MALVMLQGGPDETATLHLTSEPVTLVKGEPVEVPDGYVSVLTDRNLTSPHVIIVCEPVKAARAGKEK